MGWQKQGENRWEYETVDVAILEVFKNTESTAFSMRFDNWYLCKNSLEELIDALTTIKKELYG